MVFADRLDSDRNVREQAFWDQDRYLEPCALKRCWKPNLK